MMSGFIPMFCLFLEVDQQTTMTLILQDRSAYKHIVKYQNLFEFWQFQQNCTHASSLKAD